jgi:hypothetical protein
MSFIATPHTGTAPLIANFIDTSINTPTLVPKKMVLLRAECFFSVRRSEK